MKKRPATAGCRPGNIAACSGIEKVASDTRSVRYRCSLPGLAGFTNLAPSETIKLGASSRGMGVEPRGCPSFCFPGVPAGFRQVPAMARTAWRRWLAEREGFEPSVPFDTHDFQSCTFDHSVTSPEIGSAPGTAGAPAGTPAETPDCSESESPARLPEHWVEQWSGTGRALAERGGFEPPVACATLDFESSTFDHSDTSPGVTAIRANRACARSLDRADAGGCMHAPAVNDRCLRVTPEPAAGAD
jgi:hypothetical protein